MTADASSVLTLRGDAFQRGLTHGSLARDKIRAGVEHYGRMWERNVNRSRALPHDRRCRPFGSCVFGFPQFLGLTPAYAPGYTLSSR